MMEQNVTYVCAGTRYTESYLIANTGENGGNDYSFHKEYCEIYTDKKIIINPIICKILSKIINESKRCGDFVEFIEAGDRSPVFYYDESLSIFVARLLEIMLNCGFFKNKNIFMAKDLNVGGRKRVLRKDNPCLCDFITSVS